MIKEFKSGCWYKLVDAKERKDYWNPDGKMDFMLDGKPHKCKYGLGMQASFYDSPNPEWVWYWKWDIPNIKKVGILGRLVLMIKGEI